MNIQAMDCIVIKDYVEQLFSFHKPTITIGELSQKKDFIATISKGNAHTLDGVVASYDPEVVNYDSLTQHLSADPFEIIY